MRRWSVPSTSGSTPTSLKPIWRKPRSATSSSTARQSPTVRSPNVIMKMKSTPHHRSRRGRCKVRPALQIPALSGSCVLNSGLLQNSLPARLAGLVHVEGRLPKCDLALAHFPDLDTAPQHLGAGFRVFPVTLPVIREHINHQRPQLL